MTTKGKGDSKGQRTVGWQRKATAKGNGPNGMAKMEVDLSMAKTKERLIKFAPIAFPGVFMGAFIVALAIAFSVSPRLIGPAAAAQGSYAGKYPVFEVDPGWPQLPHNWVMGSVSKVVVDRHDNVWIIHRPRTVGAGKTAVPPVVELDARGNFVQAWGGEGAGYDWPDAEHNVFVDYKDNVWISGSSPSGQSKTRRSDDMILKFTNDGQFIKQLGGRTTSHGSKDPMSVNKPGDLFVSPKTNELYVADGYGNRRVIVSMPTRWLSSVCGARSASRRRMTRTRAGRARRAGLRPPQARAAVEAVGQRFRWRWTRKVRARTNSLVRCTG